MSAAAADGTAALVDAEPDTRAPLSQHYATDPWRASGERQPKWTAVKGSTAPCDECYWVQHETRGAYGLRRQAKHRRAFPRERDTAVRLCTPHADVWKERDRGTAPATPGTSRARNQSKNKNR
ncbi:hypothetical protein [Nocardia nova]